MLYRWRWGGGDGGSVVKVWIDVYIGLGFGAIAGGWKWEGRGLSWMILEDLSEVVLVGFLVRGRERGREGVLGEKGRGNGCFVWYGP